MFFTKPNNLTLKPSFSTNKTFYHENVWRNWNISNSFTTKVPKVNERIEVFTDGCCFGNNLYENRKAGSGVFFGDGDPRNLAIKVPGNQTNQRAEIYAAIKAIEQVGSNTPITILTDSNYVVKAMTEWIFNWKKNNFKNDTVQNRDLFEMLYDKVKSCSVPPIFKHVPAHVGIYGNEKADELAKLGAMKSDNDSPK